MPLHDENQAVNGGDENVDAAPSSSNDVLASTIPSEAMDELCSRCSSLDVLSFFNDSKYEDRLASELRWQGMVVENLGQSSAALRASSCAVCKLFGMVAHSEKEGEINHAPCQLKLHGVRHGALISKRLLSVSKKRHLVGGYVGLAIPDITKKPEAFGVRCLDEYSFDFTIADRWLKFCQLRHGSICQPEAASKINLLRVIDCRSSTVVYAAKDCQYVALSYVWGKALSSGSECSSSFELNKLAPKVILDSIKVVKGLGLRYLWVDRYCIDQSNDIEKHNQIRQMDIIYASAQFTIIAAASGDPNHGLPGVTGTPRIPQPAATIENEKVVSLLASPDILLSRSKWATRGWTFQEGLLSKRRLVFCREQVFFECNTMLCFETLNMPLNHMSDRHMQYFKKVFSPDGAFKTKSIGDPRSFMKYVREFTGRQLSYETDALKAMRGVFSVFEKSSPPVFQLNGVPFITSNTTRDLKIFTASSGFLIGLLWWHSNAQECRRRDIFPSWSWAGWSGQTEGSFRITFVERMKFDAQISVELPDKSLRPFPQQRNQIPTFLAKAHEARFIHLTAKTSAVKIVEDANRRDNQVSYAALLVGDEKINIVISFYPDEIIQSEKGLSCAPSEKDLTAVILAPSNFDAIPYHMSVLVVKPSICGEYMERVGVCDSFGYKPPSMRRRDRIKYVKGLKGWFDRRPVEKIRLG
ncbi:hypothetical protein HYFRA_00006308 [Hymenoscyphus fraxineus]|uniref:Heterokaryon incompatibility domain-containing protein n=1 Tax=Hymenoscyphus fraxineus TaxID=746836 RepID=A0A9N9L7D0_9HELO|nr:hypothetical protein HYFRA_00006308 [Hymenoscyphus fraxineus]